jgi:flagellar biosynthesis protein FliP
VTGYALRRAALLAAGLTFLALPAFAQSMSLDLGGDSSMATRTIELMLLVSVLSIVPGLAVMVTCFPFIVTVLSILRQALGLQQSPPNILIISLSLFLTWFVMDPVFTEAWAKGVQPLTTGAMDVPTALPLILAPFRAFMAARVDPATFQALQAIRPGPVLAPMRRFLCWCRPSCCPRSAAPFRSAFWSFCRF